jgi:hypothetical protein
MIRYKQWWEGYRPPLGIKISNQQYEISNFHQPFTPLLQLEKGSGDEVKDPPLHMK